ATFIAICVDRVISKTQVIVVPIACTRSQPCITPGQHEQWPFRTNLVSQAFVPVLVESGGCDRPVCSVYRWLSHRVPLFPHGPAERQRPVARQPYFKAGRQQGILRLYFVG